MEFVIFFIAFTIIVIIALFSIVLIVVERMRTSRENLEENLLSLQHRVDELEEKLKNE